MIYPKKSLLVFGENLAVLGVRFLTFAKRLEKSMSFIKSVNIKEGDSFLSTRPLISARKSS